ncbi:TATA box-binding protein-like 1 isoform X1 [Canis lupus familiaris]|uniref:TATA box-binding protein-like 1 isoform X1 n=1 Tax=Canis lupus familiaris TaxID=9615 RepID=UPI0018F39A65|nr:TATA box-binding protein-like 1 isoform X1 [Canis lupus familiaris]
MANMLPNPLDVRPCLLSHPKGQVAFSFFLQESHQSEAGVPMIPPCRPLIKSELPIGLIRGRRLLLQPSSGGERPVQAGVGPGRRRGAPRCSALPAVTRVSLRRQRLRPPPPPPGLTAPQRGGSNWRECASRGPRVTPGLLGRRATEGCQSPGAPLALETRCHLNLRKIALEGANVIYKRDVGKVLMKLRKPRITATIWSSGKIICTGATSEEEAKFGARRLARSLQKLGFQVIFTDFKVVNVLAVCNMPFEIRLPEFTKNNRPHASYEPELHPAVCYRIKSLRATLQIFSTGSITVTGPNVKAVATAVEQIYPFVFESRKEIL